MRYHDVAIAYHFGDWPTHASAQRALLKSIDAWSPSAVFEIEDIYDGYVHIASVEAGILADRWYHVWQFKSNDAKNVLVIIKQCHTVVIHCELSAAREDISASFRMGVNPVLNGSYGDTRNLCFHPSFAAGASQRSHPYASSSSGQTGPQVVSLQKSTS